MNQINKGGCYLTTPSETGNLKKLVVFLFKN